MQALGIGSGDHVGILMGNDEKWLSLFYGAALIGAVTVPVNTRFKGAEIGFCLKQADCKALFYVDRFLNIDFVDPADAEPAVDRCFPGAAADAAKRGRRRRGRADSALGWATFLRPASQ